jgi:hypothetical protein
MRTDKTTVTYQCDGCQTAVDTTPDALGVPLLPLGWLYVGNHRFKTTHLCPKCIPLVYFTVTPGNGFIIWRADTLEENPVSPKSDGPMSAKVAEPEV